MPPLELDLRGLAPDEAPAKDAVAGAVEGPAVLVRGPVPALAGVLAALNAASRTADVVVVIVSVRIGTVGGIGNSLNTYASASAFDDVEPERRFAA